MLTGFFQGAALAQAGGYSIEAYTEIVISRLPAVKDNLARFGGMIAQRDHESDQASVDVWAEAYNKSLEPCQALGVDETLPAAIVRNFETAKTRGYGDQELSAVFEVLLPAG